MVTVTFEKGKFKQWLFFFDNRQALPITDGHVSLIENGKILIFAARMKVVLKNSSYMAFNVPGDLQCGEYIAVASASVGGVRSIRRVRVRIIKPKPVSLTPKGGPSGFTG